MLIDSPISMNIRAQRLGYCGRVEQSVAHSVRFYHFLSNFEIYALISKSRHMIERSNIENVFEVLFACVNLDWRQKFFFSLKKLKSHSKLIFSEPLK